MADPGPTTFRVNCHSFSATREDRDDPTQVVLAACHTSNDNKKLIGLCGALLEKMYITVSGQRMRTELMRESLVLQKTSFLTPVTPAVDCLRDQLIAMFTVERDMLTDVLGHIEAAKNAARIHQLPVLAGPWHDFADIGYADP
eukprot:8636790-Pyramimonas_sp.AAC.1